MSSAGAPARRTDMNKLLERFDSAADRLAIYLPPDISEDQFVALCRRALTDNPAIAECEHRSVLRALSSCAQTGLPPDGELSSLVVRRSRNGPPTVTWSPTFRGLLALSYRVGQVQSVTAYAVGENDEFRVTLGMTPDVEHLPALIGRGEIVAAYAVATLKGGRQVVELLTSEDLAQIKSASPAGSKGKGPWAEWPAEMARKAALRRLLKKLPTVTANYSAKPGARVDRSTGEIVDAVPTHLSDADIAAGFDRLDDADLEGHSEWLEDYEQS